MVMCQSVFLPKLIYKCESWNWANNIQVLRSKYNLPLSDENVCNITYDTWKRMVNDRIKRVAFLSLRCALLIKRPAFFNHIVN